MSEGLFSADSMFVSAVLVMAAATYAMRAGGYWVMGRVPLTPRVRRALESLPGAIIISTILPMALQGGLAMSAGIIVSGAVMALLKKDTLAVAAAVLAVAALRHFGV
ncbi:AzlD family protein [Roseibium suaedae]|uniref:Uncharacterized membrane protein n=1 Tax=Roseibium suaedae TaxID=735517 RepID=A0A1M7AGE7_9HYPH|nr:AzlD domain-containing protein [Roseibium suaedae]SHL41830.1 Uncharacterized membrane protein [Roseibium suaedae]